jgi:hypothetical protein
VLAEKLIKQEGSTVESRLETAFRLLTSRRPAVRERDVLQKLYDDQREHFAEVPEEAKTLLAVGETRRDENLDPTDLAAMAMVVRLLFNFDECVAKR